jgi:hypothetical protein
MQTITTSNTPQVDTLSSGFALESEIVSTQDTSEFVEKLTGKQPEFKKLIAGFEYPEQCEEAITIIQKSKLGSKEKDLRIESLTEKSRKVTGYIQKVASFKPTTEEYNGFLLEYSARYDDEFKGFVVRASHPEHGSETFVDGAFNKSLVKEEAKKWVDRFSTVPVQETHQENEEPAIDDEVQVFLSGLKVGQEVWFKNRRGEFRGFDVDLADVLFLDSREIEQVKGNNLSTEPGRKMNPMETSILEFILAGTIPVSVPKIAESLDLGEIPVKGYARNLIERGLISSSIDEDGETWYSSAGDPAAVQVCEEMDEIAAHVRREHEENLPFTDIEYEGVEIELSDNSVDPVTGEILLTAEQAEAIVKDINQCTEVLVQAANSLRVNIKTLEAGKGYEVLGFKDMSDLFRSGLLEKSRSTLQKEWQAHRVEQALGMDTGTLVLEHGLKLFPVLKAKPEKLEEVYHAAIEEAEISDCDLNARCIKEAIAQVVPELKPKPKSKSKLVGHRGQDQVFQVVLPGVKIDISDRETMSVLTDMEQPENQLCPAMLDLIMELDPTITSRQEAIARLVERLS